jgi:outer membrane protein
MKRLFRPLSLATAVWLASGAALAENLQQIYELALKNDAQLKIAEATYRANIETEKQAFSRLLPQVQGSASYSDNDNEQSSYSLFGGSSPARIDADTDTRTRALGISLNQALFDLPAWFSFQSGKSLTQQAEAQFAADQQALIMRVAKAYFNVLRATDNLRASKAEELAIKRQFDQTQQRFDVGLIAITDVHEARAAFDAIVAQRLADEGSLATAYEALTVLTGQPQHANLWQLAEEFPVVNPEPADRAQWVDFALRNNFALQAARYASEAARQNAQAKRMEYAPKLTASLGYQDSDSDGDQQITVRNVGGFSLPGDADSTQQTAMLQLNVPIFTGGYISSQRRQAAEQYNAALQQRIETERQVVQSTRALYINTMTDVQRVKARSQSIVSAQSALDATQAGYEVGTRNIVDVLQAQRVLYAAMRDYANARYDYVLNLLQLKQQAGTLSPQDILDLNQWLKAGEAPTASMQ